MRETKQLRAKLAAAAVVAALAAPSVFAESSPSKETRDRGEGRATVQRDAMREQRRGDNSSNGSVRMGANDQRSQERVQRDAQSGSLGRMEARNDSSERRADRRPNDSYGPDGASGRWRDNNDRGRESNDRYRRDRDASRSYNGGYRDNRTPYRTNGRINDVRRYGNGYRVWIAGSPYPFFVPAAYYHRDRFRIGVSISLGGYYNPLGYYDYYDDDYRGAYSRGELRGTVESVDYNRDTFVIRNEATGSFVTVISRDRRPDSIRPGDYVEIYGAWSRAGVFSATDVDRLDDGYYRR